MPKVVPEYKETAKNRILEIAHDIFSRKGYYQTTMDDIASKVGVSKATLYIYFSNKEELFKGIYQNAPESLEQIFTATFGRGGDVLQNAKDFFDRMLKEYASYPALGFEVFSEATRNVALRKILRGNYDRYVESTAKFLDQQTHGIISQYLDPRSLAQSLIALWNGMETLLVVGYPVSEVKKAWLDAFTSMFGLFRRPQK